MAQTLKTYGGGDIYQQVHEILYPPSPDEFMECDSCRAKPGSPQLCKGCLHNRALISKYGEMTQEKSCCCTYYHLGRKQQCPCEVHNCQQVPSPVEKKWCMKRLLKLARYCHLCHKFFGRHDAVEHRIWQIKFELNQLEEELLTTNTVKEWQNGLSILTVSSLRKTTLEYSCFFLAHTKVVWKKKNLRLNSRQ